MGAHRSMTFVGDTDPLVAFNSWVFRDDGRLCFVWNSGLVGLKRIHFVGDVEFTSVDN